MPTPPLEQNKPPFVDRLTGAFGMLMERATKLEAEAADLRRRAAALKQRGMEFDHDAMEDERARSCTGKNRYKTAKAAGTAADKAKRERGANLRVYPCVFCDGYHLTKTDLETFANNQAAKENT